MSAQTSTPLPLAANPAPAGSIIDLQNVVKTYETASGAFTALDGVSVAVAAGEYLAIVGKSGSGKSTLINMITGIDRSTSGNVLVGGVRLGDLRESDLAKWRGVNVGVVFQFFQLLPTLTIVENVMLPMDFCNTYPPQNRRPRGLDLLDKVGIVDQADKFPAALSGGQQQRAAIARALANDPALLVADEPTGNLDSRTSDEVLELFSNLSKSGTTVVMVSHERDIERVVDRTITLADGKIEADTTRSHTPAQARGAK